MQWGPSTIALLTEGRAGTRASLVNPISGHSQRVLSTPRVLRFASAAAASGAMRLIAYEDSHHRLAAWLVLPNGTRVTRPIRATGSLGVIGDPVFTSDDRAVVVLEGNGPLHRIDLITGARVPLGFADGAFDTR